MSQLLSKYVTTYAYEFNDENAPDLFDPVPSFPLGAYHFAEAQYLFNLNQRFAGFNPFTPDQQQLSNTMIGYWTRFATAGDPNFAGAPAWSPYKATKTSSSLWRRRVQWSNRLMIAITSAQLSGTYYPPKAG